MSQNDNNLPDGWNPADLTAWHDAPKEVQGPVIPENEPEPEPEPEPEESAPTEEKKKRGAGFVIGVGVACVVGICALGAVGYFTLLNKPAAVEVVTPTPTPTPTVIETPAPTPTPTPTPTVTETPTPEPTMAPEPIITKVNQTVAVSYPSLVTTLTAADKKAILALAKQPLAEDEEVVVSGFAGSTASVEFGQKISEQRARAIQTFLAANGVKARVVGYGNTPVGKVLGKAQQQSIAEGTKAGRLSTEAVKDHRLAFVSAVVVTTSTPSATPSATPTASETTAP